MSRTSRMEQMSVEQEKSRIESLRAAESRYKEIRKVHTMEHTDPLYISEDRVPFGWEYMWGREYIKDNHADFKRQADLLRTGWTPVPASRHPEKCLQLSAIPDTDVSNHIRYVGLILMERPLSIGEEERDKNAEEHDRIIRELPGVEQTAQQMTAPIIHGQARNKVGNYSF